MSRTSEAAQLVNETSTVVDGIAALIAKEAWDTRKVLSKSFYSGTPFNSPVLYQYDASQAQTGHDGWSVINPNHLSTIGSANWYTSTGDATDDTGTGCWVREAQGGIYIEEAGGQAGSDCTTQLTSIVTAGINWIQFGDGTYQLDNYGNPAGRTLRISGTVTEDTHIEAVTDYSFNITQFGSSGEGGIRFEHIVFTGAGQTKSGIYVDIRKAIRTYQCVFTGCIYGIRKNAAFGDKHYDTTFTDNDYGVYGEAVAGEGHVGFDKYVSCMFRLSDLAAVYKDSTAMGEGGLDTFIGCQFEPNSGFDLFYLNSESTGDIAKATKIINCWFEGSKDASVTINGTSYTPRNIMLDNSAMSIEGGNFRNTVEIKNGAYLKVERAFLFDLIDDGNVSNVVDLDYLVGDDDGRDYPVKHLVFRRSNREATSKDVTNRPHLVTDKTNKIIGGSAVYDFPWSTNADHTVSEVSDGLFYESKCREVTYGNTNKHISDSGHRPSITDGKYYVFTLGIKKVSGSITQFNFNWEGTLGALTTTLKNLSTEWKTYKTIFQGGYTDASEWLALTPDATGVVRFSKLQLVEFDTKSEAIEFTGSDEYVLDETHQSANVYKQGSIVPTLTTDGTDFDSVTYDPTAAIRYTRTGNKVHIEVFMRTDAVTVGAASGNVLIGNLPYTINNGRLASYLFDQANWGTIPVVARGVSGTSTLQLFVRSSLTASLTAITASDVFTGTNSNQAAFSMTYTTNDPA